MNRSVSALSAAFALCCAATTNAAAIDLGPLSSGYSWQGFYAGVQAGGSRFATSAGGTDTGFIGGGHAGYLWQMGNIVVGPEIDANISNLSVAGTSVDAVVNARVRAGFVMDRTIWTASLGYGHMWASAGGARGNDGGLIAGAGVDFAVTNNFTAGADYTYHRINSFNGGADLNTHTIRARAGYRFN
jgi:outer membrane immunogenic protein